MEIVFQKDRPVGEAFLTFSELLLFFPELNCHSLFELISHGGYRIQSTSSLLRATVIPSERPAEAGLKLESQIPRIGYIFIQFPTRILAV